MLAQKQIILKMIVFAKIVFPIKTYQDWKQMLA